MGRVRRKGFKCFISLAEKLQKDEIIVLVGLSEIQIKQLPTNIIGISRTNNIQELAEIYTAADVFVNPTLEDNFPNTNLESIACGTPVITFKTGGSIESIDDKTGAVVEKGNINELIRKIRSFKNHEITIYKGDLLKKRIISMIKREKNLNI